MAYSKVIFSCKKNCNLVSQTLSLAMEEGQMGETLCPSVRDQIRKRRTEEAETYPPILPKVWRKGHGTNSALRGPRLKFGLPLNPRHQLPLFKTCEAFVNTRGPRSAWAKMETVRGRKPDSGKRDTWETPQGAHTLGVHAPPLREGAEFGGRKPRVGEDVCSVGTLGFSSPPLGTELLGRTIQRLQISSSGERYKTWRKCDFSEFSLERA